MMIAMEKSKYVTEKMETEKLRPICIFRKEKIDIKNRFKFWIGDTGEMIRNDNLCFLKCCSLFGVTPNLCYKN